MKQQKSLVKNAMYSFFKAFLTLIFPIITFPYASRILMPEGIGKVNFANSIIGYFLIISSLGIHTYATREVAKLRDDKTALTKFTKEMFTINMVSSAIAYTLFVIVLIFVPKLSDYRSLLIVCSVNIILTTLGIDWFYNGIEEYKYITIRSFIFQILSLAFLFTCVRTKDDVLNYAIFGIMSSVGSKICNIIHLRKFIDFKLKTELEAKKHLKFIFTFFGMSLVTSVYTILDSTMLGFLTDDIQVGYYSAATKLNKLTLGLLSSTFAILLPRMSYYLSNEEKGKFNKLVQDSLNIVTLLSIPMVFGMIVLARPLVLLFSGANYIPAIPAMNVMSPIIFSMGLATITGVHILPSIGKEKVSLISYICGALSNVTINFILIPKYGCIGAGIGTLCAESLVALIQFFYLSKMLISKDTIINFLEALIFSILMYVILFFFIKIEMNLLLQVLLSILIGVIQYSICLLIVRNKTMIQVLLKIKDKVHK